MLYYLVLFLLLIIKSINRFLSRDAEHYVNCTISNCIIIKTKTFQVIRKITQIEQHNHNKDKVKYNIAKNN